MIVHQSGAGQVDLPVIQQGQSAANQPAGRVTHSDGENRVGNKVGHYKQVTLAEQNKGEEHQDHRCAAVASAPERGRIDLVDAAQHIKWRKKPEEQGAGLDNSGLLVKEGHQIGSGGNNN